MEVDVHRKRIGLSMRLEDSAEETGSQSRGQRGRPRLKPGTHDSQTKNRDATLRKQGHGQQAHGKTPSTPASGALAAAFAAAKDKRR
jgi:uncharacterized protein